MNAQNTRSNQITFLTAFSTLWVDVTAIEAQDGKNGLETTEGSDQLTIMLNSFCNVTGLPQMSADDLLLKLQDEEVKAEAKLFFWKDKSGRGQSGPVTLAGILNTADDDEVNYDDIKLAEWAESAEQGEEWENSTDHYVCTEVN